MEQKLLQILKEKGMRMSNLAAKLGMDQSNLSKKLRKDPKLSLVESIANALDVPISTFFPVPPPAASAGVLAMDGKRFALVPLPDETEQEPESSPEASKLTPETLQEKIRSLAHKCLKDGRTRAIYGFLSGHLVVVLFDSRSHCFLRLFWEDDGEVTRLDYPLEGFLGDGKDGDEWDSEQVAELIVNDITETNDL